MLLKDLAISKDKSQIEIERAVVFLCSSKVLHFSGASDLGFCALTETDIINQSELSNDVYDQSDYSLANEFPNSRTDGAEDLEVLLEQCKHVTGFNIYTYMYISKKY